jgi:transposase
MARFETTQGYRSLAVSRCEAVHTLTEIPIGLVSAVWGRLGAAFGRQGRTSPVGLSSFIALDPHAENGRGLGRKRSIRRRISANRPVAPPLVHRLRQKIHIVRRLCQVRGMAQEVSVIVGDDRARLEVIVKDRNQRRKHVQRAQIVLLSAYRLPVAEVARQASVSRPAVWRWQRRFAEHGVSGLLRDKTRPPGTPPLPDETVARVVAMTCAEPPGEATHWTGRAMAKQAGISLSSVQRIWAEHDLQPHRLRTFKRSNEPGFAEKLRDIVGLYVDPPAHSLVLSLDEKSHIQALDRTQPACR